MTRRWPLLFALLPLLLGLAVYGQLWRGWAAGFETTLAAWFPGRQPVATGFPYRLEAELVSVDRRHEGAVHLRLAADRLRLNRGPWRPELTVLQGQGVRLSARLAGLAARIAAASGTASLQLEGDRLDRLSIVPPAAAGNAGIGPDFRAESFELHARERVTRGDAGDTGPSAALRGQLVVNGEGVRLGQGAPLSIAGEALVNGAARLDDYARWSTGGGSIDASLSARDASGEIFALSATLVPQGAGFRLSGSITTVCPASVAAALAGTAPPAEARLRAPVRLAIETALPTTGPVALSGQPPDLATRPRRRQIPACPRLK